jgi:hypothetical protein
MKNRVAIATLFFETRGGLVGRFVRDEHMTGTVGAGGTLYVGMAALLVPATATSSPTSRAPTDRAARVPNVSGLAPHGAGGERRSSSLTSSVTTSSLCRLTGPTLRLREVEARRRLRVSGSKPA